MINYCIDTIAFDILFGGIKKSMEGRIGAKIWILAVVLFIPAVTFEFINFSLVFSFTNIWLILLYILVSFAMLFMVSMMILVIILVLRKPETIGKAYKHPSFGVIIGFIFCLPIIGVFIIQGEYQHGDAITSTLFSLCGILFFIASIVMIYEVRKGTEQVDHEI